ncbi:MULTISPECIES: tellurite resistance TerB family protein [Streptomyces]|uniref:TerB family tellurite resistance protein n=1 Tax=Streptomyces caniscabiei TaxID=2746961 RepID=A0ABU4MF66_9ACTN|nr:MULTISPECIES: TerB family tellurite resistance protein [Streptomyces]MBE4734991.1 TerB family tellurite resistance protein [Streptomyces caniscabiei]MBE4754125.1 TerB family tellurite resistance protein [Streptomyces caniscabiei]MBE4767717.1 TerB family tellurite resistance protein [Streptomyces caniscabiei]MBE4784176.1 TerB family tellurite resistance protein [Streptomyces caniscabiei]MBE4791325.1 TerB family tellurite resistance protein [Streptomyces caniscabiei]
MAMWDRIKDQAKGLQQQAQGARGGSGHGQPGAGPMGSAGAAGSHGSGRSSGGSKAQLVSALKSQLTSLKTELKSGAYRDASMAMCALVAAADGNVDPAERQHVESLILNNDVLQNFPADQLRQRFNRHVDQLSRNFQQGKAEALTEIAKAAKKPTEARAVVQTGFVVAGADGYIAQTEEQVLREACATLGLSPQEFGL